MRSLKWYLLCLIEGVVVMYRNCEDRITNEFGWQFFVCRLYIFIWIECAMSRSAIILFLLLSSCLSIFAVPYVPVCVWFEWISISLCRMEICKLVLDGSNANLINLFTFICFTEEWMWRQMASQFMGFGHMCSGSNKEINKHQICQRKKINYFFSCASSSTVEIVVVICHSIKLAEMRLLLDAAATTATTAVVAAATALFTMKTCALQK